MESNKTKIVHITAVDMSIQYFLLNQLIYIQDQDYLVYAISSDGKHVENITRAGIKHIPVNISRNLFSPFRDLISLISLIKVIRKEKYDLVHTHTPKASFLGQMAAKFSGTPVIIRTLHGFYFHENSNSIIRRILILMETIAAKFSTVILSQNQEDIQTAIDEGICKPNQIRLLGNGIDVERFNPLLIKQVDQDRTARELSLDRNKKTIGFVGRLVAEKGVPELIQAAKKVIDVTGEVQFLFVGPVDYAKKDLITPEIAQEYGIADHCIFTGHQDDMPLMYSLMDILVLPSHREGFPRSVMEASAMKIPSVVTDIRGNREVIVDGENGKIIPLQDVDALSEAILYLLAHEDIAKQMGEVGRKIAEERFDEKKVFKTVVDTYQEALKVGMNQRS